jgi:mono/diheme cytochrome c family protein
MPMSYIRPKPAVACFILLACCFTAVDAQPATSGKTLVDGVYSEAQALRGKAAFTAACSKCHGDAMQGVSAPALTGDHFVERWREDTLDTIYKFLREYMPPAGQAVARANIPANDYLDILAYIFKTNGYRAGAGELSADVLGSVMFVGKNGPQPVPDGSLTVTVGCLAQDQDGTWLLQRATEPARTRFETTSTPAELRASSQKSLGTLTFRLATLDAVPGFKPDAHKGQKLQAKGYLVRQPNAERIQLSAIEILSSNCGQ